MTGTSTLPGPIVEPQWLLSHIANPKVVVLDASWYLPDAQRNGRAEFEKARIPGARFFDFDTTIADTLSPLPHMLPAPAHFEAEVRALGINSDSMIVCYDGSGLFSAPRAWWMFKAFGHSEVAVLNGGRPAWLAAGGPLETGPASQPSLGNFTARPDPDRIADLASVRKASDDASAHILDARSSARFAGEAPEPRPGLRAGHMPNARNLPLTDVVADGRLLPDDELAAALAARGVDDETPVITTCGSGVTASVLALAIEVAGHRPAAVYDGSWAEWGSRSDTPVVTGKD